MEKIVEIRNISKSFGSFQAVSDLSFSIHKGDVYGFLGQNGAGKSTTMRMLLGLIYPDSGKILINGEEFGRGKRRLLRHIGAIIERPDMYGYLSGWDNLRMFATLSSNDIPDTRLHEVLELVGLKGREQDKVKAYSQGMKQRLGLAIALVHGPELLILDEPTNGLDPQGIAEMRHLILSLSRDHGKTVLVSSHLLHEIELVATSMLILHRGKKVAEGKVSELLHPDEMNVRVTVTPNELLPQLVRESAWGATLAEQGDNKFVFRLNLAQVPELSRWMVQQGAGIVEIKSQHSLEEYFLSLTND